MKYLNVRIKPKNIESKKFLKHSGIPEVGFSLEMNRNENSRYKIAQQFILIKLMFTCMFFFIVVFQNISKEFTILKKSLNSIPIQGLSFWFYLLCDNICKFVLKISTLCVYKGSKLNALLCTDIFLLYRFANSVAIIQYLAEKYGQGCETKGTFYPKDDPIPRTVIHHRLAFHLSTFQRRVYDYMILPMDYDYERTGENRIKLAHALRIFDEFLKRHQEQKCKNVTFGLYATGGMLCDFDF